MARKSKKLYSYTAVENYINNKLIIIIVLLRMNSITILFSVRLPSMNGRRPCVWKEA